MRKRLKNFTKNKAMFTSLGHTKLFFKFRDIIFGITSMPPFGGDVVCQVTYGTDNNPSEDKTEPKMTHDNHQLPIGKNSN